MKDIIKICIACSAGGHLVQAKQLSRVYKKYEYLYFTFEGGVAERMRQTESVLTIPNIHRNNPWSWLRACIHSVRIAIKEKPDIIITTGAGVVFFFCIFSKALGAKLIFLESMARIEKPTLTARLLYPFSDLFIVQWPGLKRYFPKAKYFGRVA